MELPETVARAMSLDTSSQAWGCDGAWPSQGCERHGPGAPGSRREATYVTILDALPWGRSMNLLARSEAAILSVPFTLPGAMVQLSAFVLPAATTTVTCTHHKLTVAIYSESSLLSLYRRHIPCGEEQGPAAAFAIAHRPHARQTLGGCRA